MSEYGADRLKSGLWISAQVRVCGRLMLPVYVARRGDPDAGAILLKLIRGVSGCEVLSQVRGPDGEAAWMRGTGPLPVAEADADAYVERRLRMDPDAWVLEIEDPRGLYQPDGGILP